MLAGPIVHDLNFQVAQALPWGLVNAVHCNRDKRKAAHQGICLLMLSSGQLRVQLQPGHGLLLLQCLQCASAMVVLAVGSDRLLCKTS